jgi:F0F1-type ATP synthase membrane subunit b/b'
VIVIEESSDRFLDQVDKSAASLSIEIATDLQDDGVQNRQGEGSVQEASRAGWGKIRKTFQQARWMWRRGWV